MIPRFRACSHSQVAGVVPRRCCLGRDAGGQCFLSLHLKTHIHLTVICVCVWTHNGGTIKICSMQFDLALFPGLPCFCFAFSIIHGNRRAVKNGDSLGTRLVSIYPSSPNNVLHLYYQLNFMLTDPTKIVASFPGSPPP